MNKDWRILGINRYLNQITNKKFKSKIGPLIIFQPVKAHFCNLVYKCIS